MVQLQEFITDKDLAKLLGISVDIVRSHRKRHDGIPWYRFGRSIRYRRDDVIEYIEKNNYKSINDLVGLAHKSV